MVTTSSSFSFVQFTWLGVVFTIVCSGRSSRERFPSVRLPPRLALSPVRCSGILYNPELYHECSDFFTLAKHWQGLLGTNVCCEFQSLTDRPVGGWILCAYRSWYSSFQLVCLVSFACHKVFRLGQSVGSKYDGVRVYLPIGPSWWCGDYCCRS